MYNNFVAYSEARIKRNKEILIVNKIKRLHKTKLKRYGDDKVRQRMNYKNVFNFYTMIKISQSQKDSYPHFLGFLQHGAEKWAM